MIKKNTKRKKNDSIFCHQPNEGHPHLGLLLIGPCGLDIGLLCTPPFMKYGHSEFDEKQRLLTFVGLIPLGCVFSTHLGKILVL